jgi:HD-GYP domain-containing protein (c-di-GMP phosphodiesterase class II)
LTASQLAKLRASSRFVRETPAILKSPGLSADYSSRHERRNPQRTEAAKLNTDKQRISVEKLSVGMYVSELDRPWIETPFLFQGFHIETDDVIEELRHHCKFVLVDIAQSDCTIALSLNMATRSGAKPGDEQASDTNGSGASNEASIDDTQKLKAELGPARVAHSAAEDCVRILFEKLKRGSEVDVKSIQESLDPMIGSIMRNDDAMSWLARMKRKDDYVYDHSISSSVWALIFGKHLGLDKNDLMILGMGAMLMDVGKTRIPKELLRKSTALDEREMKIMKAHVQLGTQIASKIPGINKRVVEMIACHHERYNGTGYPQGLSGSQIPVFAKIAGIVDSYDAMTSVRPYAHPISTHDAIRQLNKLAGVEFPQELVEQFVQAIGIFPVGTLVELNTGEVGVVIAQNRVRRLRPKIMLLLDKDKAPLVHEAIIDLRNQLAHQDGRNSMWIERGLTPGDYGIDPSEYYL